MKLRGDIVSFILFAISELLILIFILVCGCATSRLHGDVVVNGPTLLVTGPAHGHLVEESDGKVGLYTVRGNSCVGDAAVAADAIDSLRIVSNYHFTVDEGKTLCAIPMKSKTRVLLHAERP